MRTSQGPSVATQAQETELHLPIHKMFCDSRNKQWLKPMDLAWQGFLKQPKMACQTAASLILTTSKEVPVSSSWENWPSKTM